MRSNEARALKLLLLTIVMIFLTEMAKPASLSWENTTEPHPERKPWSQALLKLAEANHTNFTKAKDWQDFCPNWYKLTYDQQLIVISELVIAVTYYESGFNPLARMLEYGLGNDPITGKQVMSEGLLQLSYGDQKWAPWCQFKYHQDVKLPLAKRSILNPITNMNCGVRIFGNQVARKAAIVASEGAYWSVLKRYHKNQKVKQIQSRVRSKSKVCE